MTATLPTRSLARPDSFGGGFAGSLALHAAFAALLLTWGILFHRGENWGSANATAGAIQATMVSQIPLPPKPFTDQNAVLATETPSPAPPAPAPRTIETPIPDAIPIPIKPAKPAKTADRTTPAPPLHPQPFKAQPDKAPAGESPAPQMAMSTTQTRTGTFAVGETDATFGVHFGYYNDQIKRKLMAEWYTTLLDKQATGHRVYIAFQVARDGSVSHIQVAQPSGDATLDQVSLSAVRHIDTFGPLPDAYQGSYINVMYYFEAP